MARVECMRCGHEWEVDGGIEANLEERCLNCGGDSIRNAEKPNVELSVIMPVMNQDFYTKQVLDYLCYYTDMPFEIIVIDNGSTDDTPNILKEASEKLPESFPLLDNVVVITNEYNLGISASWNLGLSVANGEYIAIVNNDIILLDGWASKMIEVMKTNPDVWAISPKFSRGGNVNPDFESRAQELRESALRYVPIGAPGTAGGFAGFCFIISKAGCENLLLNEDPLASTSTGKLPHLFDEQFFYWYSDTDFWYRCHQQGHQAVQSQNVLIHHYESQTISKIPDLSSKLHKEAKKFEDKWDINKVRDASNHPKYSTGCLIAIPSRGPVDIVWTQHMINLVMRSPVGLSIALRTTRGIEVAEARNFLVREALRGHAKWIMFIDDDTLIPITALSKMILEDCGDGDDAKQIVTGVVYSMTDPSYPCVFLDDNVGPMVDWKPGELIPIKRAGLACTAIRTEIFEKIPPPWFKSGYKYHDVRGAEVFVKAGEDFYFYDKALEAGIQAWCDTSMLCDHLDVISLKTYPPPEVVEEIMKKYPKELEALTNMQSQVGAPPPSQRNEVDVRLADIRGEEYKDEQGSETDNT